MALAENHSPVDLSAVARPLVSVARGTLHLLGVIAETFAIAQMRAGEAERLIAMSDRQLAARGLTREDIAGYIFRERTA